MDKGQFDILRDKLLDAQMPVDSDIWQGIESSLRRRRIRKVFLYASSAAAVLIAALLLFVQAPVEPLTNTMLAEQQYTEESTAPEYILPQQEIPAETESHIRQTPVTKEVVKVTEAAKAAEEAEPAKAAKVAEVAKAVETAGMAEAAEVSSAEMEKPSEQKPANEQKPAKEHVVKHNPDNNIKDYLAEAEPRGKEHSVSLFSSILPGSTASVTNTMIKATSAGAGAISQSYSIEQISDTRYSLPVNLGIQFQFPVGNNMALGIGANYTMLRSRYDCLINKKKFNIRQTLHYIGIPVNIYGLVVDKNNFSFYLNAGFAVEKGIKAAYYLKSYDSSERSFANISGVLFSANAGMGVEYKFSNTVRLYLEPNIVYYINSDIPRSLRTDQPLQVKAEMGFRFRF